MTHKLLDEKMQRVREVAENYLKANGFEIVGQDKHLFPNVEPATAALKEGRLLVFAIAEFPSSDQFLRPEELTHIRDDLDEFVNANAPSWNSRVSRVDRVALVVCSDEVNVLSPVGDIKWLVVRDEDEVPEELDRLAP